MNALKRNPGLIAPIAVLLGCLTAPSASAEPSMAEKQARIGCESYANTLLGLVDGWRFENNGQTFDLRQQNMSEDIGIEMFQAMFDSVNHRGLKRFLNDTVQYLWDDEDRARRFITSGRFMQECVPANTELMEQELQPVSKAEIQNRLRSIRQGVAQGRPVTHDHTQATPRGQPSPVEGENHNASSYRSSRNEQNQESTRQSNQQQPASGLSSRR